MNFKSLNRKILMAVLSGIITTGVFNSAALAMQPSEENKHEAVTFFGPTRVGKSFCAHQSKTFDKFLKAIMENDYTTAEFFIRFCPDVRIRALNEVVFNKNDSIIDYLAKQYADTTPSSDSSLSKREAAITYLLTRFSDIECKLYACFHKAFSEQNFEVCNFLASFDKKFEYKLCSPFLHVAILYKHLKELQFLIHNGADVNRPHLSGETPLHIAVYSSYRIFECLINAGADFNIPRSDGLTILQCVFDRNKLDMVSLLLTKGANIDKLGPNARMILDHAYKRACTDPEKAQYLRSTGLHGKFLDTDSKKNGYVPYQAADGETLDNLLIILNADDYFRNFGRHKFDEANASILDKEDISGNIVYIPFDMANLILPRDLVPKSVLSNNHQIPGRAYVTSATNIEHHNSTNHESYNYASLTEQLIYRIQHNNITRSNREQ